MCTTCMRWANCTINDNRHLCFCSSFIAKTLRARARLLHTTLGERPSHTVWTGGTITHNLIIFNLLIKLETLEQRCKVARSTERSQVNQKWKHKTNSSSKKKSAFQQWHRPWFRRLLHLCSHFAMWNSMRNVNTSQLETCWKQNNRKIIRIMQTYKRIIGLAIPLCPCGIFVTIIHVAVR